MVSQKQNFSSSEEVFYGKENSLDGKSRELAGTDLPRPNLSFCLDFDFAAEYI